ncbi:hypothetical protein MPTK1_5g15040 [Marchantia polymorpha subsp. ruderalis]|uniref:Uncharacterized protein n=2 Tax=Marchantia polymorpha TaxID=3197 RepID=A0AAF6BII8_MARPO|nr:hypothetical protein MARPO_0071s0106 [Marchantia polymorpha]BBN11820.1 hypothetical protein Mp_5g15040 [Marchantia polymorpha subsp. ruderalis]PTQ35500.1 hypothetical protein MARPO_0071s0106 [Marchantia polymorpha]PTQ35501.1 hypothetical protein MARPO_0071s0106 [Marchantia polymorpha]PTQ35502.1 hypothetical protein MARPO_0071s0106 [Marchantia polymorpha]|eukprot:PTQ35499.1 hypothetical protein MARPO_0071s0106 [Marchantia polymorpha]
MVPQWAGEARPAFPHRIRSLPCSHRHHVFSERLLNRNAAYFSLHRSGASGVLSDVEDKAIFFEGCTSPSVSHVQVEAYRGWSEAHGGLVSCRQMRTLQQRQNCSDRVGESRSLRSADICQFHLDAGRKIEIPEKYLSREHFAAAQKLSPLTYFVALECARLVWWMEGSWKTL